MSYALYLDPSRQQLPDFDQVTGAPGVSYLKLTDIAPEAIRQINWRAYPAADYTIAEIHPAQWDAINFHVDRLSIVLDKSGFQNMTSVKSKIESVECDITFNWDHRFHVSYYFKILQYWMYCGAKHFSFYELTNFAKWQQLKSFLGSHGFHFYDRYHACLKGHASRYQKHIARFGDLMAVGGWSRVTVNGKTHTRAPDSHEWVTLTDSDAWAERMLFAFADVEGVALDLLQGLNVEKAVQSGLTRVENGHLIPTDSGLWDTVGILSQLQQN